MQKIIIPFVLLMGAMFLFTNCEKEEYEKSTPVQEAHDFKMADNIAENCMVEQTLWAGAGQNDTLKGTDAGTIKAWINGAVLTVVYQTSSPWVLTEAHLWVGNDMGDVPKNAAPGRFPFKKNLDFESEVTFNVDLPRRGIKPGETVYIAAHGVVVGVDGIEGFELLLPVELDYTVTYFKKFAGYPDAAPLSYFLIDVEEGFLSGTLKGWCLDTSTPISLEVLLNGVAYSSYGDLPSGLFDKPENLSAINWIINKIQVGDASLGGFGSYRMGDFQRAFWTLLEDDPNLDVPGGVGTYDDNRVAELVSRALENGVGYIPHCGDKAVILLVSPNEQTTFIEMPVPCGGGSETVWAFGDNTFIDAGIAKKWGWIFSLDCPL